MATGLRGREAASGAATAGAAGGGFAADFCRGVIGSDSAGAGAAAGGWGFATGAGRKGAVDGTSIIGADGKA